MKSEKFDRYLGYLCVFVLPLLAIGFSGVCFYRESVSIEVSPPLAFFLSIIAGTFMIKVSLANSDANRSNFVVASLMVIVLVAIMMQVLRSAHEGTQKRTARRAIRKALREHGAIYPQPIKKGTQPDG